ncbi:MAG TPA: LacI family DNA-binding transcriptional regulator [Anaerolineae bacterium]|jgi:DNA-binding LacI/PurR family transcriptional regulator
MAITIQDVAERAGVGLGTVSRVINGARHVRPSTRLKVEAAMHDLNYHPNPHASNLKRQKVKVIGFLMTSNHRRPSDPFFITLMSGITDAASRHRYDLLVAGVSGPTDEIKRLEQFVSGNRVGGLILTDRRLKDARIDWLLRRHVPFVSYGRIDESKNTPYLDLDSRFGVEREMMHLIECGHSRIAFVGLPEEFTTAQDRFDGYRAGLRRIGRNIDKDYIITGCWNENDGLAAAERLLSLPERPTAIVASSDVIAFGIMRSLQLHGLTVGQDVAVVGFDDIPMAAMSNPPLTTLRQPIYDVGVELVDMLIRHIAGQPVMSRNIESTLIVRQSSCPLQTTPVAGPSIHQRSWGEVERADNQHAQNGAAAGKRSAVKRKGGEPKLNPRRPRPKH